MSRKKIFIAAGSLILLLVIIFALGAVQHKPNNSDGKEPEQSGPTLVQIQNSEKLNAFLNSAHYSAVTDNISTYILTKVDADELGATIDDTSIAPDGTITLVVTTRAGKEFTAKVSRAQNQTIFTVPKSSYKVVNDLTDTGNEN